MFTMKHQPFSGALQGSQASYRCNDYGPYISSASIRLNSAIPNPLLQRPGYTSALPRHNDFQSFPNNSSTEIRPPVTQTVARNELPMPQSMYSALEMHPRLLTDFDNTLFARTSADDSWDQHYRELLVYCSKKGTCNVPFSFVSNRTDHLLGRQQFHLGSWLSKQRGQNRRGVLAPERKLALQKLADRGLFSWDPKQAFDGSWNIRYTLLNEFKIKHGHTDVPLNYKINRNGNMINLGEWVQIQRRLLSENKLQEELQVKLQVFTPILCL
jgi:hypothetical protein